MTPPLLNPVVPFVHPLPGAPYPGQLIRIEGEPIPGAKCFAINLQIGPSVNPRDDIALHISPVFTPPPRIVRNSLSGQRWGPEESHGGFPLVPGVRFDLLILVENEMFKIAINGLHFTEFRHRLPVNMVNCIAVDGDVRIFGVSFDGAPLSSSGMSAPSAPPMAPSAPTMPPMGNPPPYPVGPMGMPSLPTPGSMAPPYGGPPPAAPGYSAQPYPASGGYYPPPAGSGYAPQGSAYPGPGGSYAPGPSAGYSYGQPPASATYPSQSYKKSSPIPIGLGGAAAGVAAGVGAAALGAAMLGHHPMKKMKKLYKFKRPKFGKFKHKFGKFHKGWKHKGWSSCSDSSCSD